MKSDTTTARLLTIVILLFLSASCKKEVTYVYDVNNVTIYKPGARKPNVKSTLEFISISYSDLFGTTISQADLFDLGTSYAAFGDLKFIEEKIIKNFLNKPGAQIPTLAEMNADVPLFIKNTYIRFYNREPTEFESWNMVKMINDNAAITPELIYFSMMTSNEYRYY
jgi:hypothetical protein